MAFSAIKSQLENEAPNEEFRENIDHIEHIFELACLLHDIGHAPFSHTGETFYLDKKETLYSKLKETVDCPNFTSDFDALATKKPAEHECMSCIVGLKTFSSFFNSTEDRSLFARCIIGMPTKFRETAPNYKQEDKSEKRQAVAEYEEYNRRRKSVELQNCIIEELLLFNALEALDAIALLLVFRFMIFLLLEFNFFFCLVVNINLIFNINAIDYPSTHHAEFNKIVDAIFSIHFF